MTQTGFDKSDLDQLRLQFPEKELTFEDMCISSSNEIAVGIIRMPDDWPTACICVIGPAESGLTTIANAWALEMKATRIEPRLFDEASADELEILASGKTVIDRGDIVTNERNLLYLINRAQALGGHVLLTSATSPSAWEAANADLMSRLQAMPIAELQEPDELLLKARLSAACQRRFIKLPDEVSAYLAARMERSYTAIEHIATQLDTVMESQGRKLTIPLARSVLPDGLDDEPESSKATD